MTDLKWKTIKINETTELKLERQGTIIVRNYFDDIFIRHQISDYVENNGLVFIHSEGIYWWKNKDV